MKGVYTSTKAEWTARRREDLWSKQLCVDCRVNRTKSSAMRCATCKRKNMIRMAYHRHFMRDFT